MTLIFIYQSLDPLDTFVGQIGLIPASPMYNWMIKARHSVPRASGFAFAIIRFNIFADWTYHLTYVTLNTTLPAVAGTEKIPILWGNQRFLAMYPYPQQDHPRIDRHKLKSRSEASTDRTTKSSADKAGCGKCPHSLCTSGQLLMWEDKPAINKEANYLVTPQIILSSFVC